MGKLRTILRIRPLKFIKYNFLSPNIKRDKGKYIIPYRHAVIDISKNAQIELHNHLFVCDAEVKGTKRESIVFLRDGAKLVVNGVVTIKPGSTLQVQHNATLEIGKAHINYGSTIIAGNHMKIGNGILISRNCVIFDSDFHKILDKDGNQVNTPRDIEIGDHVWIGVGCNILRGSIIGEGAMIAAGSVVGGKIKPHTMASGNPARSYSEISWEE